MMLLNDEEDDSTEVNDLTAGYLPVCSRWPGSRGNPIPEGVEILAKGPFWWAPGLKFLVEDL